MSTEGVRPIDFSGPPSRFLTTIIGCAERDPVIKAVDVKPDPRIKLTVSNIEQKNDAK